MSKAHDILNKSGAGGAGGGRKSVPGAKPTEANPYTKPASTADSTPKSGAPKSQRGGGGVHAPSPAASKVTNVRPKV